MKLLSSLPAIAASLLLFASCETTSPDERFFPVNDSEFRPQRTVLIEEFTGQTCVNCPNAHTLLGQLEERFNTNNHLGVLSVGIHIPLFGREAPVGFVAPEAEEYSAGVESAPSARINRRTGIINTDKWTGEVLNEILRKSPISFGELTATLNAESWTISISGSVRALESVDNDSKLQLWLVEDDIVKPQLTSDGPIKDYIHHAVFRSAINGVKGEPIELKEHSTTSFEVKDYLLPEYVNLDNLRVVAFVYSDADGVLNATHKHIERK